MEWINALPIWNMMRGLYCNIGSNSDPRRSDYEADNQVEYFVRMQELGIQFYRLSDDYDGYANLFISLTTPYQIKAM